MHYTNCFYSLVSIYRLNIMGSEWNILKHTLQLTYSKNAFSTILACFFSTRTVKGDDETIHRDMEERTYSISGAAQEQEEE